MAHVLKVIPTYNNDGQKFIEHRAFILHVIFKEDIFIIQQPTEFLREKVTAKVTGSSPSVYISTSCTFHVWAPCVSGLIEGKAV